MKVRILKHKIEGVLYLEIKEKVDDKLFVGYHLIEIKESLHKPGDFIAVSKEFEITP